MPAKGQTSEVEVEHSYHYHNQLSWRNNRQRQSSPRTLQYQACKTSANASTGRNACLQRKNLKLRRTKKSGKR